MRVLKSIARLVAGALAVCACATAPLASRPAAPRGPRPAGSMVQRSPQPVPAPFQSAVPAMVSIVTADIDGDGDLDVVASDSELQLYVWLNDGSGHFVRQRPSHASAWRTEPPGPTVQDRPGTAQVFAQNDRPSGRCEHIGGRHAPIALDRAIAMPGAATPAAAGYGSSPRAPPASLRNS